MKIVASIQARLNSQRLPRKVLREIDGKPMLWHHIQRLKHSRLLDNIVVATTTESVDDEIVDFCKKYGVDYYRGSEDDVLDRVASMVEDRGIDIHVECFGDSPLTDPHIVDEVVGYYLKHRDSFDFVSNSLKTTYPPGQEVLVYSGESLIDANRRVPNGDPLREHVSIHITEYPDRYRLKNLEAPHFYNYPDIYLEVDTAEDFEMVSSIFHHFHSRAISHFSLAQILDFLSKNGHLVELNRGVERRWREFREDG
ncbi:MAG: NTP transferase domain-containing protein [Epsilonproteobacteria bacterium]|nr:NTP transferase domain-containing protein [Campylobacterota bacterium]